MKDIYAVIIPKGHGFEKGSVPLSLKSIWHKVMPYSTAGVFWTFDLTEKEKSQLGQMGFPIVSLKAEMRDNFVFYNEPFEEVDFSKDREWQELGKSGVGLVIGMEGTKDREKIFDFVAYLRRGFQLFNGKLLGGGVTSGSYFLTGFIPSGNMYLLQEAIYAMKMALELFNLRTKAILYLLRYDTLEYEGKGVYIFDNTFVEYIGELANVGDFELWVESALLSRYPSLKTAVILKNLHRVVLSKKFYIVEGVYKTLNIGKKVVGRENELRGIISVLKESMIGEKKVIGISGPFGVGKTSLILDVLGNDIVVENGIKTYYIDFERGFTSPLYGIKKVFETLSPPTDFNVQQSDSMYLQARLAYVLLKNLVEEKDNAQIKDVPKLNKLKLIKLAFNKYIEYLNQPAIFILDDVEFIDPVSREILFDIIKGNMGKQNPLCFILSSRKKGILSLIEGMKMIELAPIPYQKESIPYLMLNKSVSEDVNKYIYEVSRGYPFLMEQVTKYLKEQEFIAEKDGVYVFSKKPPRHIKAEDVIKARMQTLNKELTYILELATLQDAILPLSFYSAILEHEEKVLMSPKEDIQGNALVVSLVDKLNEIFYISKYAYFKKIRFENLLLSTRKNLHKKIVQVIEEKFKDDLSMFYPVLAHHAQKAGLKKKELLYLKKMYEEAYDFALLEDAIQYLKRLLEIDPENSEKYLKQLAEVYSDFGKWDMAEAILKELIEKSAIPEILSFSYRELAYLETYRGRFDKAQILIDMSMGGALKAQNFEDVAGAYMTKGTIYWAEGRYEEAEKYYRKSLEIVEKEGIKGRDCVVNANMGFIFYESGKNTEAMEYLKKAVTICKDERDYGSLINVYINISALYGKLNDLQNSVKYALYAIDVSRQKGFLQYEARAHLQLALVFKDRGEYARARKEGQEALSLFKEIEDRLGIFRALMNLGRIAKEMEENSIAIAHFVHAMDEAEKLRNSGFKIDVYLELADLHEVKRGIHYLGLAYKEAVSKNNMDRFHEIAIKLARLFKNQGKTKEALRTLKDALVRVQDEWQERLLQEEVERVKRQP